MNTNKLLYVIKQIYNTCKQSIVTLMHEDDHSATSVVIVTCMFMVSVLALVGLLFLGIDIPQNTAPKIITHQVGCI